MASPLFKDPAEDLLEALSFSSAAISVNSIVVAPLGLVAGAAPMTAVGVVQSGGIWVTLSGGTDGERYSVTVRANFALGGPGERSFEVVAIDPDWTMPDGSIGWLSVIEFVDRYGFEETVIATDARSSGTIDRRFLIGALRDAQAEAETNLAGLYALPLNLTPGVLKTAVADIARIRLYPRGAPDGVVEAAKAQRRLLERVASGALTLPGVAGVAAQAAPTSDAPTAFHSGGRAYPDGLAGY